MHQQLQIHCSETPDIPQPLVPDIDAIEQIVLRIMDEQSVNNARYKMISTNIEKRSIKSEEIDFGNTEELLGTEGVTAIAKTMASFRV